MKGKVQGNKCWNCGQTGSPHTGSRWICTACDVIWFPIPVKAVKLNKKIVYGGKVIDTVDFTRPTAPSSPA